MTNQFFLLISLAVLVMSCKPDVTQVRIISSAEEPIGEISGTITGILNQSEQFEATMLIGEGAIANIDSINRGSADLAIIENHTMVNEEIRSVLALYPQILHILYKADHPVSDFKELVSNRKVFIGLEGSGTYRFMMDLFEFYEVDPKQVQITENPFDCEVYCGFGDIIKDENLAGMENFMLYSFDDVNLDGKGSIADAIALKHPQVRPFILPRNTYRKLTPDPVLTLSVDAVLVAREDLSKETVYSITSQLLQNHQAFARISPLMYLDFEERYDHSGLNFPLHDGARMFLDKDQPGFFERFAELIGVVFTLIIATVSGLFSLAKWNNQRKKDRIDVFYKKVIEIKNNIMAYQTLGAIEFKIEELQKEENRAFDMLINEKLRADESFRIYMELNKELVQALQSKYEKISDTLVANQ